MKSWHIVAYFSHTIFSSSRIRLVLILTSGAPCCKETKYGAGLELFDIYAFCLGMLLICDLSTYIVMDISSHEEWVKLHFCGSACACGGNV